MDEQKTQTSAQPEHIPLLLIARELWRKLGLILMFAATVAACGYIAATLLYRPVYQTQTTFVVSVRNGSTVYANLNTASSMAETLSTFFEGDVMRKCITNDIGAVSGTIKAKQIPETNLLTMTVSAPTQRDAHRITQSVLRSYNEQANKLLGDVALDVLCRPTVPVAPANSSGAVRIAKLSGLAGLLAAALYLAVRVYLRDTVKCEADVEQKLDTRLLATVRHEKKYKTLRAQLCLRKRKTSILITNPTTGFAFVETFKRRAYEWLMRKLIWRNATQLLGCSTDACEFVFGPGCMDDPRCRALYNGFDVDLFRFDADGRAAVRKQYGLEESFVVGHVGRFEEQKNHRQLIEQFAAICAWRPDAMLLCVGRGSLMDEIRAKSETLGISDRVIFAGAQKDTPAYYSAMDVFLFPSLYEGLGSVLIEAQANGLSVITTQTVVPQDIDVTGRAAFVPLEAPAETWAEAVLSAPARETDGRSAETVKALYDIQSVAQTLCKLYQG